MDDEADKRSLSVAALPIGQGDAILIRWVDHDRSWTCLVDGGGSARKLQGSLRKLAVEHLDLLVVTHLDSDHIAGLGEWITESPTTFPTVDCYWGPALAAFERHKWLFGPRCTQAIERGRRLEDALRARDESQSILYPLEGFTSAPLGGTGPRIEVLNPPGRLLEYLLTADDISQMLTTETTPMGWLLQPQPPVDDEDPSPPAAFAQGIAQRVLDPASLADVRPSQATVDPIDLATSVQAAHRVDPLFFGNKLFNNSSLVLWLDLPVGGRRYSALLTGDLENWTYLTARHRKGLQPDLLKAPHHGGRVYIEGVSGSARESADALHRFLRPKAVLVSSVGGHGLPHETTRDSWIRWGATVLCTCERGRETIVGPPPPLDRCCTLNHGCSPHDDGMDVRFDETTILASRPACHSGFGDRAAPPVIVHQQVVNPSPALEILGDLELRRYLSWVSKKLRVIHEERVDHGAAQTSEVVRDTDLATMAVADRRKIGPLATHLTAVLDAGMKREDLWSAPLHPHHRDQQRIAYTRPRVQETDDLVRELRKIGIIAWPEASATLVGDRDSFVLGLGHETLAKWARSRWGFPVETFRDLLLPTVLSELRKPEWSILAHPTGGVLMICGEPIHRRFETMIGALRHPSQSQSWSLSIAIGRAFRDERKVQLEQIFESYQDQEKSHWGQNKQTELDKSLRETLEHWEGISLPTCAAWTLSVPLITGPSFALGEQGVVLGHSSRASYALLDRVKVWLRPTAKALQEAGYFQAHTYEELLAGVVEHGLHWRLYHKKSSWSRADMQVQFDGNGVQISTLDPQGLDATVSVYAELVLASFQSLDPPGRDGLP
ncbi:ComEC/Rec2 family competence protein [Paraliomyxa miuraensis]|uniref:ComEC/Rec2 family competence protein n=1 Tax=Paraliomyxa miuraensis TaxID=376150 RepID=UPI002254F228|nr:MBL fold metallo-hydrolase [Paraliomyxa miuraensis]MCX4239182.1 MBL fold metallo-hydrolase [Paraliomyxa miuraensis]